MCGILFSCNNKRLDIESHNNAFKKIYHRGPDNQSSIVIEDKYFLAHSRLSILDLSSNGNQPFSIDKNNYILFNGEIYNYKYLREKYFPKTEFISNTDTELLLRGFLKFGELFFEKLDGIFSIVIFCQNSKKLIVARDKHGIKPLYIYKGKNQLSLCSEVKPFQDLSRLTLNKNSIIRFLIFGSIIEPFTIYNEINAIEENSIYIIDLKTFKSTKRKLFENLSDKELVCTSEKVIELNSKIVEDSIINQTISDTEYGVFLSGGLDSSIISYVLGKSKKINTISISQKDNWERINQELISKELSTNHISWHLREDEILKYYNEYLKVMDQPTIDGFNVFLVSILANQNKIKVCLSGIGADENYFGYPSFKRYNLLQNLKKLPLLYFWLKLLPKKFKKLEYLILKSDLSVYIANRALFSMSEISKILNIDKDEIIDSINEIIPFYKTNMKGKKKLSFFEKKIYCKNQLLKDADVFGMSKGVEIRVPFLNVKLDSFLNRLKNQVFEKGKNNYNKPLLVNSFKSILPKYIYQKQKIGFTIDHLSSTENLNDKQKHAINILKINNYI